MSAQGAPQRFGKYQILERIAAGGMAEVYRAQIEGIGGFQRTFAIKRILPHLSQNAEYIAMLVDEAKVAGLLSHANIVQILDLGQVDGVWFIAMEHVRGRDLGAILARCRERGLRLPVPHAVFVALELLKALEYAHQRQVMRGGRPVPLHIIHRDVSPPNILLGFQGEVKLTDFGIARASLKMLETQEGILKGRFDYMSPEQAEGAKDLDQRSDLFSVGVVLYEMLTGEHPFRAASEIGTLESVREGRYRPLSSLDLDIPFSLETLVDRALRRDRAARFGSATAFKEALDKFFHESGFLFTHNTLATFVRGLFPEEVSSMGFSDPSPDELRDDRAEGELPTRVMDRKEVVRALDPEASRFGPPPEKSAIPEEDATAVRRNPLLGRAEAVQPFDRAAERSRSSWSRELSQPRAEDWNTVSEVLREAPTESPHRRRLWTLGGVTTLALALGSVLGGLVVLLLAVLFGGVTAGPPVLTVDAPPAAVVRINGAVVAGPTELRADQPQQVEVSLDGYGPWRQRLVLGPGEHVVLRIKLGELEPEAQ